MEISVEMCLAGRDLTEPKPSPDGATVAFVARWVASAIIVVPIEGGPERIVTTGPEPAPGRGLGGGCFDWLPDGSGIVYAARDGNLWLQPLSGAPEQVTRVAEGSTYAAPCVTPDGGGVVGVVDQAAIWWHPLGPPDDRRARRLDEGRADFVVDPCVSPQGDTVWWTAWNVPDMPWDAARVDSAELDSDERASFAGPASIHQPRALPDGRQVCVRDDTGWLNVWVDGRPLVDEPYEHAGPTWGHGQRSYAVSPDGAQVAFARNERGFGRLCVADIDTGLVREVARGVHGQVGWRSGHVTAIRSGARTPSQIVAYDTSTWERTVLAVGPVAGWDSLDLPEPEPVEVEHDGAVLHARRFRSRGDRTICWVHGGPTDQWQVEFMPRISYWWSRGWDVLVPDPRGSTGHGRSYQQALRGQWGRLDVDDTAAILRSEIEAGRADPDRTVLMGGSSGGLTVLGVLARHPDLAAGGVTPYPVSDLAALAAASHRFEAHYTDTLVGPPGDPRYVDWSPVHYATEISKPLLVLHGDADPVVPIGSSRSLVDRIRSADGDVEFVVYGGEGHGFRDPANKRDEYERVGEFLRRVVGIG